MWHTDCADSLPYHYHHACLSAGHVSLVEVGRSEVICRSPLYVCGPLLENHAGIVVL